MDNQQKVNELNVSKSRVALPPRIVLYGEHKIGKSTFGKDSIKPVFLQIEDGLEALTVDAFDQALTFEMVKQQLADVYTKNHPYRTLVIDSLDWLEKLIWDKVCQDNGVKQIGDVPYGGGYKLALNLWREFLADLDLIRKQRRMMVILLAHSKIVKFEDPTKQNYDRYDLDLHEKAGNLVLQWADIIGFANEQVIVTEKKEGFGTTVKAKDTGIRMLNLNKKAAYEAGNRWGLQDCELSFEKFWEQMEPALKRGQASEAS